LKDGKREKKGGIYEKERNLILKDEN